MPVAENVPLEFSVIVLPANRPVEVTALVLMLVIANPDCVLVAASTWASSPPALTLLPLNEPVRPNAASCTGERIELTNELPAGLYEIAQPVCTINILPLPFNV